MTDEKQEKKLTPEEEEQEKKKSKSEEQNEGEDIEGETKADNEESEKKKGEDDVEDKEDDEKKDPETKCTGAKMKSVHNYDAEIKALRDEIVMLKAALAKPVMKATVSEMPPTSASFRVRNPLDMI